MKSDLYEMAVPKNLDLFMMSMLQVLRTCVPSDQTLTEDFYLSR